MAESGSKHPSLFDVQTITDLVGLMSQHDLTEIDLREGDLRIRLRRGPWDMPNHLAPPAPTVTAVVPHPPPAAPAPAAKPEEAKPAKNLTPIKSPTPGTFYAASGPDTEPFVRVGSRVSPTTVVCLIEAMKIFNEITADCSGVITEICVENQQPVEYGQVLFKVDPTA